ncbi:MAG: adenylosuccinate lyase [Chlamydiae bacterium CG10_big_fil_rev_8_21_14_0_10_35_9]|nr:MAG: adenylosuccinate lyase [Chlamydiae bacterium CG10_big_fil_rev_8_21_14_0_10_35_9]
MLAQYQSPLTSRYASPEMSFLFSDKNRYSTFRKLWLELAKAQKKLGLPISEQQIAEMEEQIENIDFEKVKEFEKELRHDVMAHIHAFSLVAPSAKPIIHLGATSCFVTDNADLIILKKALQLTLSKLVTVIDRLADFAKERSQQACLAYTHFQPAQPTTIGKRACLWLQDFLWDLHGLEKIIEDLPFLGAKGATGSQSSFLQLFSNNHSKVEELDRLIAKAFDFNKTLTISAQTYSRKIDLKIANLLEEIACSSHKFASDIRLLSHTGEIREKFGKKQVGSSAMPFKKNPIYSERICSIARFIISLCQNPAYTAATQWLERSLDDSANRRLSLPEIFLSMDAILNIFHNLISDWDVDDNTVQKRLQEFLPFLCMENLLMKAVKKGGDRQHLHEKLRAYSQNALDDFFEKVAADSDFQLTKEEIDETKQTKTLIGRSEEQVHEFITNEVTPILQKLHGFKASISKVEV